MPTYQEVFVPGGFPRHTYNPRIELKLEEKLSEVRQNLCKLVTVTGQTKSGKTVLVRKVLPREEAVWIDGGVASTEEDFWQLIVDQLELFQDTEKSSGQESARSISGEARAAANFFIAKGEGTVGGEISRTSSSEDAQTRTLSSKVTALRGLQVSNVALVIDDFHYLPKDLQADIVRALKPFIFDGLPVVIIAIPHRRYDALKVEKEMTGRIFPVEIPTWSEDELRFIPDVGFKLLGHIVDQDITKRMTDQAIGSPHLIQEFCRGICRLLRLESAAQSTFLAAGRNELEEVFAEVADTIGRPIFEKLARGPRQRSDRMPRELRDGSTVDIYELVLHALAYMKPGLISIEYEDLRTAIKNISAAEIPQLHEIARVLKHMSTIASTDESSTPVIDFEEDEKKLHVTDPFFAFYLRWGQLSP
jgi:hypothetical protein